MAFTLTTPPATNPTAFTKILMGGGSNTMAPTPAADPVNNPALSKKTYTVGGVTYNSAGDPVATPATAADPQAVYNTALEKQLAALKAAQAPIPRMVTFDSTGAWAKARDMATQAVSPIYQQKMTDFIARQQQLLGRQQADANTGKGALDEALTRFMTDSATNRARTAEDTNTAITDINATQDANARQEGLDFDTANRSLSEGLGAAGTAESGLGAQQVADTQATRLRGSNEQVRQSTNKVAAANTLMSRTFEDLNTGETRKENDTTSAKTKIDLDLERFIEDQAVDKDQEQKTEDLSKASDIASQSIDYKGQLVDQWIQSLAGKGYTAQEIANAASIYK